MLFKTLGLPRKVVPIMKMFAEETTPIGLIVNWKKTQAQSLRLLPPLLTLAVNGELVKAVTAVKYLGEAISTTCRTRPETTRRLKMARASTKDLDHVW